MTVASSAIKKTAKESLKNNCINAVAVSSVILFCYLIIYCIASSFYWVGGDVLTKIIFYILNFFMFVPVLFGGIRYFWRMLCGVSDSPLAVFYTFTSKQNYLKVLKLTAYLTLKTVFYGVLMLIPYFAVTVISSAKVYEFLGFTIPLWSANLSNIAVFLKSIALIGTFFLMLKYYLSPMLLAADEGMDVNEAVHMSVVISKNTVLDFIYLLFSMLGWVLLSVLFIPLIYTIPLFITVYLTHSSIAVSEYNEHIKELNSENFPSFMAGI